MNATIERERNAGELATRIAPHLSCTADTWQVLTRPDIGHGATLRRADGAELWITIDYTGRAECAGVFPEMANGGRYAAGKDEYARIAFDPKRDARLLARDIERRCLSVYVPALVKAREYVASDTAARAEAAGLASVIAGAFGKDAPDPRPRESDGHVTVWLSLDAVRTVEVCPGWADEDYAPRVEMRLTLTGPQALAVLRALEGEQS